jgi:hypothetical protein
MDNRDPLSRQPVEQTALADIGTADDGDGAGHGEELDLRGKMQEGRPRRTIHLGSSIFRLE